jgi:hypothetical protein
MLGKNSSLEIINAWNFFSKDSSLEIMIFLKHLEKIRRNDKTKDY